MIKKKRSRYFGKKGNAVLDGLTILIVLTVFGLTALFSNYLMDEVNTDIASDSDMGSEAKLVSSDLNTKIPTLMDNAFLICFILFTLFVVVSVFMIDTHPVFFIFSVVLLVMVFVVGGLMANAYDDIARDDDLSTYANNLTYTGWVMSHLLELIIGIGFLTMITMFAKFKNG